jgi:hypothetical protein
LPTVGRLPDPCRVCPNLISGDRPIRVFCTYKVLVRALATGQASSGHLADITYIRLLSEFVYLAVILNAFSRRVIG